MCWFEYSHLEPVLMSLMDKIKSLHEENKKLRIKKWKKVDENNSNGARYGE